MLSSSRMRGPMLSILVSASWEKWGIEGMRMWYGFPPARERQMTLAAMKFGSLDEYQFFL